MPTRRLLYLSAHQMTAFRWQAGTLLEEGRFEATEADREQFADYLARYPRSIFSLLANVAEEGFQVDTIPYLHGADRKAIIDRKFGQLFFNSTLTASHSLGHQKSRRKNERVMLAALTNSAFFEPWLAAIAGARVALSGLYTLPLLGPALLGKLGLTEERCLLLTVQDQSIRQSYFEQGELHFSRLTPLHSSSIGGIAQSFATEALKMQQYLTSQRLIGRNQAITAHIVAHANALKAIDTSCIDTETMHFEFLDIADCARQIGLKTLPTDTHCELLFLHLLAAVPPRTQFADDVQRHDYHLWQLRSALYGAGAVALFSCLLFAGTQLLETYHLQQESATLKADATLARLRYNNIAETFPPIPANNETLRRVIDRYAELENKSASPDGLYREISRALHAAAPAELDQIDWKVDGAAAPGGTATSAQAGTTSIAEGSETAIVRGTLKLGANATPRQLLAVFNQFVDALKANPKLQLNVLQQPFDIEPGKSLKGGDVAVEDDKPRAFSIQISRKIGS
jgi:hypothetical protein